MIEHEFPRPWPTSRLLGRLGLRLLGWRVDGLPPAGVRKAVIIACPHTSNWDYVYALLIGWSVGLTFTWLGKEQLFRPPLGWLLRALGGRAIDRSAPQGQVAETARLIERSERILLMVPAEGTRSFRPYWKSGFRHIALQARVPIVLGYLDFPRKRGGFGPLLVPTDDVTADMDVIRAFYADKGALHPECKSRVRLRVEDEPAAQEAPHEA